MHNFLSHLSFVATLYTLEHFSNRRGALFSSEICGCRWKDHERCDQLTTDEWIPAFLEISRSLRTDASVVQLRLNTRSPTRSTRSP